MPLGSQTLHCPLCGSAKTISTRRIPTAPIANYWRSLGYDLGAAFPGLPDTIGKNQCLDCDLRFFSPQMIGGPDLYSMLGAAATYYDAAKWEFVEVLKLLAARPQGGMLLEYGCGNGAFLEKAAPLFDRAKGVDFNSDAVKYGQSRGLDIVDTDLAAIGETFDVVACFQILEHVPSPADSMRELTRLVAPGGLLIVAVPNEDSLLGELDYSFLNLPPHHASCWTRETFTSIERLLPLKLEAYLCEPLDLDLYLGALHQRLESHLGDRRALMKPFLWFIHRAAIAQALVNFDKARSGALGHTHIAVYRKASQA
jgi:SAM-dependent methyltransferase